MIRNLKDEIQRLKNENKKLLFLVSSSSSSSQPSSQPITHNHDDDDDCSLAAAAAASARQQQEQEEEENIYVRDGGGGGGGGRSRRTAASIITTKAKTTKSYNSMKNENHHSNNNNSVDSATTSCVGYHGILNKEEIERYSRQLILSDGFGVQGQKKLINSTVLVVGCGGIGSTVIMYLASCGIGTIYVIDHDYVEISNLHRQIIHRHQDATTTTTTTTTTNNNTTTTSSGSCGIVFTAAETKNTAFANTATGMGTTSTPAGVEVDAKAESGAFTAQAAEVKVNDGRSRRGINKAISACRFVHELNPMIKCIPITERFNHDNVMEIMMIDDNDKDKKMKKKINEEVDVRHQQQQEQQQPICCRFDCIIDASDNPFTRYLLNDVSKFCNIPLISGSAIGTQGQITVYNYNNNNYYPPRVEKQQQQEERQQERRLDDNDDDDNDDEQKHDGDCKSNNSNEGNNNRNNTDVLSNSGCCYRCLYPNLTGTTKKKTSTTRTGLSCTDVGVLGPVPGLIGILQSIEAIKVLTGIGNVLSDRLLMYDSLRCTFMFIKKPKYPSPNCLLCTSSSSSSSSRGDDDNKIRTIEDSRINLQGMRGPADCTTNDSKKNSVGGASAGPGVPCGDERRCLAAAAAAGRSANDDENFTTTFTTTADVVHSISCKEYNERVLKNNNSDDHHSTTTTTTTSSASSLLSSSHVLLDVRSKEQYEMCSLPNAINLPLSNIVSLSQQQRRSTIAKTIDCDDNAASCSTSSSNNNSSLDVTLRDLSDHYTKSIYCICRRGVASIEATKIIQRLQQQQHQNNNAPTLTTPSVFNIEGGLVQWRLTVDPSFPKY